MKIGTKSLLFGAHQFLIHPLFVAWAWWKMYGFPWDPRLWLAFIVHDWGYWGCPDMDGDEGGLHPYWAADLMYKLFGMPWWDLCVAHSRHLAYDIGMNPSRLCYADKLAMVLEPRWLYLLRVWLTGEVREYMANNDWNNGPFESMRDWHRNCCEFLVNYVAENSH